MKILFAVVSLGAAVLLIGRPQPCPVSVSLPANPESNNQHNTAMDHSSAWMLAVASPAPAQKATQEDPLLSKFMQQKLDASSEILKGLMIEDFTLIEANAEELLNMSREEKWRASNDMMYLQHSTQFRNVVDELRQKAARESIDGASLAWVNVTMSCIQCHQWVRNIMLAEQK